MKLAAFATLALLAAAGCHGSSSSDGASQTSPSSITDSTSSAVAPVAPSEVIAPRGESFAAADYAATVVPYRLFGTSKGDGLRGPFAVIANTRTWSTRSYWIGDTVGRGLKVAAVDEHGVTLRSATQDIVLTAGVSSPLRIIEPRLDSTVTSLGKLAYGVDLAKANELSAKLPEATTLEIYSQTAQKLGPVDPETLLGAADFQEGDFLVAIDGAPVSNDGVAQLHRSLSTSPGTVAVRVVRSGATYDRMYVKR